MITNVRRHEPHEDDGMTSAPHTRPPEPGTRNPMSITRREFVEAIGAGLLISVVPRAAPAQRAGRRGGRGGFGSFGGSDARTVAARVHIGKDGRITVMTGKVEGGQGARTELTQAAAEELRVSVGEIHLVMGDTGLVPDDGITAGSRTTPATVPALRQGCAAARNLLIGLAAERWGVDRGAIDVRAGKIVDAAGRRELAYADLAASDEVTKAFAGPIPTDVEVTPVKAWKVMGVSVVRPNARDIVKGAHTYPSDIARPGMLYGKVLRAPSYGARLRSIDLAPAKAMKDVVAVQDGDFVGVAAPTTFLAEQALAAIAKTAVWEPSPQPSSKEIFAYLRVHAQGLPKNPFADEVAKAAKSLKQTYHVAYVQHAPLETRAVVAEWDGGKLTVWISSQAPFSFHSALARAFDLADDHVRVIVPDFGGGFGGKHRGEFATEAARLAKAAGKPVSVHWTREEEFTWAYFRPAAVIEAEASMDGDGRLTSWHFVSINPGGAGVETPYNAGRARSQAVSSESPLQQSSYRALAATANNFARECFMDELAEAAGKDPLEFRLAHLQNPRLRAVLETAAKRFNWAERRNRTPSAGEQANPNAQRKHKQAPDAAPSAGERAGHQGVDVGVGLACCTEKGSYVAACAEIEIDRKTGGIRVRHVCEVFECGAIINPANLLSQVQGCIIMGMGPALREAMEFEGGRILNASFWKYPVPRFADVPELDIHLLDRPDLPSVGAGETPITVIAPAIANAVFHATGKRVREMPIRLAHA